MAGPSLGWIFSALIVWPPVGPYSHEMTLKCLFFIGSVFFGATLFAAGGSSSSGIQLLPKGSTSFFGFDGGTLTPDSSANGDLNYTSNVKLVAGADISLFGPLYFSASMFTGWSSGNINYKYTDANKATYTAQNVDITQTISGLEIGLQIRLINAPSGHLFIEGGGFAENWSLTYDFTKATNTSGQATPESPETVAALGTYGKVGIDLLLPNGYGLRFGGRASKGTTAKLAALNNGQQVKYVTGEGFVGLIKQY